MNHAQLKAFHVVATEGSFTRAARFLGLTQPALTIQVQALEQRYETELFIRRGRTIELTVFGSLLLRLSKKIFSLEDEVHQLLTSANTLESGKLSIGTDYFAPTYLLTSVFSEKYPNIEISITEIESIDAKPSLDDYDIDLAILSNPILLNGLNQIEIVRYPFSAVMWRGHELAKRSSLTMDDLKSEKLIHCTLASADWQQVSNAFATQDIEVKKALKVESMESLREAVVNGFGIALVPSETLQNDTRLTCKPLEDIKLETRVNCYYLKERATNIVIDAYKQVVELVKI